jgi:hypothetical protein
MIGLKSFALVASTLVLAACAVEPPVGPQVLALPPSGKNLSQFQQEDASCRNYAAAQIGPQLSSKTATTIGLQQHYDMAYAQCMATNGNKLEAFPPNYASYYIAPDYYDPWFGPDVGVAFIGGGGHFHHFHHGFHGGSHGFHGSFFASGGGHH